MRHPRLLVCLFVAAALALALAPSEGAEPAKPVKAFGPDQKQWDEIVDKAIKHLKSVQDEDGSWSGKQNPGITGIVVTGMLETGKVTDKDPSIDKGLKFIEKPDQSRRRPHRRQGPASPVAKLRDRVNVLALTAANGDSYKQWSTTPRSS